jgi:flagellar biosynthesis component FlhA
LAIKLKNNNNNKKNQMASFTFLTGTLLRFGLFQAVTQGVLSKGQEETSSGELVHLATIN